MALLALKVLTDKGETVCVARGEDEVSMLCTREYEEGDRIILEASEQKIFLWIQLDDAMGKSLIYLTGNMEYIIPFGEKRVNLSPKAFYGSRHLLHIRTARDYEIRAYRNMAVNVYDNHDNDSSFPHASANVETRGEAVFAARNAIDGVTISNSHGEWPFASWGINQRSDAWMKIDFGRKIIADRVVLYLRADFPHDNWWEKVTLRCSDGSTMTAELVKTKHGQEIAFEKKEISWIKICEMKKSSEPSPFPALTQMEVYGRETARKF